jgi:hypothetical protein
LGKSVNFFELRKLLIKPRIPFLFLIVTMLLRERDEAPTRSAGRERNKAGLMEGVLEVEISTLANG